MTKEQEKLHLDEVEGDGGELRVKEEVGGVEGGVREGEGGEEGGAEGGEEGGEEGFADGEDPALPLRARSAGRPGLACLPRNNSPRLPKIFITTDRRFLCYPAPFAIWRSVFTFALSFLRQCHNSHTLHIRAKLALRLGPCLSSKKLIPSFLYFNFH